MPELIWEGKDAAVRAARNISARLLEFDSALSVGDGENLIVQGDNLQVMKALLPRYKNLVRCIYIDPPYNTGAVFEHYNDNFEHATWLNFMYPRLEMLREFLSDDGFFCCEVDDAEGHYLKILLDEIFGRENYLTTIYIQVRYPNKTLKEDMNFHKEIEQIHVYRKSFAASPNLNTSTVGYEKFIYEVVELEPPFEILELGGKKVELFRAEQYKIKKGIGSKFGLKEIWASGTILDGNSSGRFFRDYLSGRYATDGYGVLYKVHGIGDDSFDWRYFTGPKREGATKGKYYQGVPLEKLDSEKNLRRLPIENFYDLAANFGNCRHEGDADFRSGKKPEILLKLLLNYFSDAGDLVMDCFLGSGTTAAVAHKMNRRYIGIELGEQAITHVVPRLKKVINGEQSGISKDVGWTGGGEFKFARLGEKLFTASGAINPLVTAEELAAHIWFNRTGTALTEKFSLPLIGIHDGAAIYLIENILTEKIFATLPIHDGQTIIYGAACRLSNSFLRTNKIIFKQLPTEIF